VLDEPITVYGVDLDDVRNVGMVSVGLLMLLPPTIWLLGTLVGGYANYRGKRGKPPGAVLHWLHEMQLLPLPGLLPPRPMTYSPW